MRHTARMLTLLVSGLLMAGLISACGSSSHPPKTIVKQKAKAKDLGELHFYTNVSGKAGVATGKWRLEFEPLAHQAFLTTPANKPFSTGQLLSGDRVKFGVLPTCHNTGKPTTAIYSYHMTGTQLTFTKQSDSCAQRATVLTGQPWTKQT